MCIDLKMIPEPILDTKEISSLAELQSRYEKLVKPSKLVQIGNAAVEKLPEKVRRAGENVGEFIGEKEITKQALNYATEGFKILEETAAKLTISENVILNKINKDREYEISKLEELCLVRSYDIAKLVSSYKNSNLVMATLEGAGTGALGFVGLIPNIVLSTFLYFRAIQSVAMLYGYDVKNDCAELEVAASVFISAMNPKQDAVNNELTATIGKFMVFTETTTVKRISGKSWGAMIEHGGLGLMAAQIRALSNKAAQKALQNAGKEGLEQSVLKNILAELGRKTTLKNTGRMMPVIGGVFGAFFDTAQMKKIIDYAEIFYSKRFIEEKEFRINQLMNNELK